MERFEGSEIFVCWSDVFLSKLQPSRQVPQTAMRKKPRRGTRMEFTAEVWKRGKTKFWVEIPDDVKRSLGLKEGDFVKVVLKPVEKKTNV